MKAELQSLLATSESPALGPGPRPGVMDEPSIRQACSQAWARNSGEPAAFDAFLALVLLWHDHHEPSHELAQAVDNVDGEYVHAILHRREPDYANAKYWFRRVGRHPAFAELGRRASECVRDCGQAGLAEVLVPGGRWDPMAFVDACEAAAGGEPGRLNDRELLREIQRIEFEVLAGHLSPEH